MKNNVSKYFVTAVFLCSTFIMFADDPGTGTDGDPLEGGDPPLPIDGYVWVLAAMSLVYVFLRLRAFALQGKASKE